MAEKGTKRNKKLRREIEILKAQVSGKREITPSISPKVVGVRGNSFEFVKKDLRKTIILSAISLSIIFAISLTR